MTQPNQEAIEAWNTVLFDKFLRFRHLMTTGLAGHGDAALAKHPPKKGARVLDLGCGFGDASMMLATMVGEKGHVLGVDAAERFLEFARKESAHLRNVRFQAADVQTANLGGPFDFAFSRFGMMFFANPAAALRNIGSALKPNAPLCMVVWRKREDNAFVHIAEQVVKRLVPLPETRDAPTCGPGPFSMADADTVSTLLIGAEFEEVTFERNDMPICIGRDLDESIELAMGLGPAGEILRLAGDEAKVHRPAVEAALREALGGLATPKGVFAPSSAWIVTARAAG